MKEIEDVLKAESVTIRDVFPNPEQVLGSFLQRVFQQSVRIYYQVQPCIVLLKYGGIVKLQQRLELVLDKTATLSHLAFLRTLQAARASTIALAEELKTHGLTEHPEPLSSSTTMVIDQNVEELFLPYLQDRGYMDREKISLEQLYSSLLFKFREYHVGTLLTL
jgi:hypothetical protein